MKILIFLAVVSLLFTTGCSSKSKRSSGNSYNTTNTEYNGNCIKCGKTFRYTSKGTYLRCPYCNQEQYAPKDNEKIYTCHNCSTTIAGKPGDTGKCTKCGARVKLPY